MLTLMQIMNYMLAHLEYTTDEVAQTFEMIEDGSLSLEGLIAVIGLEVSPTMIDLGNQKIKRWPSALSVTKMRLEE